MNISWKMFFRRHEQKGIQLNNAIFIFNKDLKGINTVFKCLNIDLHTYIFIFYEHIKQFFNKMFGFIDFTKIN
jgi:hypothetical protein